MGRVAEDVGDSCNSGPQAKVSSMSSAKSQRRDPSEMLHREEIANRKKHWVRAVTACNSKCLFCSDADTPRNVYLEEDVVKADLRRGIEELGADKVIISGGEASLHPLFPEFIRYAKEIGYDRVQTVPMVRSTPTRTSTSAAFRPAWERSPTHPWRHPKTPRLPDPDARMLQQADEGNSFDEFETDA